MIYTDINLDVTVYLICTIHVTIVKISFTPQRAMQSAFRVTVFRFDPPRCGGLLCNVLQDEIHVKA
jgi:hypothetical protein